MELQTGKIKTRDLAEWFGVSYDSFRHSKTKYLNELKEYASFNSYYGGIEILRVYISEYINKKHNTNYELVKENVDSHWDKSGIDSKKKVAEKIQDDKDIRLTIAPKTTYNYVCKSSNELYGRPNSYTEDGEIGNCWWVICPINRETSEARSFTTEEIEKRKKLKAKFFKEVSAKKIEEIKESIYLQEKNKEITEEECKKQIHDLEAPYYMNYLTALEDILPDNEKLGYRIYKEVDAIKQSSYNKEKNFDF